MIAHTAFFSTLGTMRENDPAWSPVLAGLAVLRLIDSFRDNPDRAHATEEMTILATRAAATAIHEGDPTRELLLRIISLLDETKLLSPQIGRELFNYGRALEFEARYPLAADVFNTIAESFSGSENTDLVIEASTMLGAAARMSSDWKVSDRSYARAQHLADTSRNRELSLTVRVGVAGSHMVHGNLPAAEEELAEVLNEARAYDLQQVEAKAIHAQASVAHLRGDYQRAVHLAYRSLELTLDKTQRERLLADIAAAYHGLGMLDAARDGYSIVAVTSPHQWVRWQATINLMELAVADGDESQFDNYVAQASTASLDPRLQAYSLYYQGLGMRRFERDGAEDMLSCARAYASNHQLHQLAFEIEQAIESPAIPTFEMREQEEVSKENSDELRRIAKVIMHLREDAVAQSS
jgi:tetratricopeptide (TPR) repeat protein